MDYVVGSVAALISGNVTPSRPRLLKRALTPTKHQASPNVTPKSEFVEDRSKFLSPTLQKKKAIVKKSPKRIFENPDLDVTESNNGNSSLTSPKAEKVKKHLKNELDFDTSLNKSTVSKKSVKSKLNISQESVSSQDNSQNTSVQSFNENTPKKKKKKLNAVSNITETVTEEVFTSPSMPGTSNKSPKKLLQRRKSVADTENTNEAENQSTNTTQDTGPHGNQGADSVNKVTVPNTGNNQNPKKKNKRRKKKVKSQTNKSPEDDVAPDNETKPVAEDNDDLDKENVQSNKSLKNKNKKQKKAKKLPREPEPAKESIPLEETMQTDNQEEDEIVNEESEEINPNAITNEDSDSEHDSDDNIESENEEINKKAFDTAPAEESSDEEDEKVEKAEKIAKEPLEKNTEEEIQRTLFVGNVPFSNKCKKEIKKIFSKYGQIETIRIRTVPIKDGRFTPKLAVIKNELHPERTTVNVYVKYADPSSVDQALSENNCVLNEHHLRVSRSASTGAEHDPRCSVFVGNLPFALEDEAFREKFQKCGDIHSVRIVRDKKTNAGKGFGYVNFMSKDGVELALALTEEDLTIKNRILRVKRCTQATNKQKQTKGITPGSQGNQSERFQSPGFQGNQGRFQSQGEQGRFQKPGFQGNQGRVKSQGERGRSQGPRQGQGRFQRQDGNQGRFQGQDGNQGRFQRQDGNQGRFQRQDGNQGRFQRQNGNQGRFQRQDGNQGGFQRPNQNIEGEGAHRRIMNKRKNQDAGEGPPDKRQKDINQPIKEKKARKEFVGITAEKKKKRKFDKGQKKKKVLSEILSK